MSDTSRSRDVRDMLADASVIGKPGWKPRVGIEEGTGRFVRWLRNW